VLSDIASVVAWIPDSEALYLFAGSSLDWPLTESQLSAVSEIDGRTAWVLADESNPDVPVGHADLTISGSVSRIGRLIVDPERRGERLGTTLVLHLLDKAREFEASRLDLLVIKGNTPALRTYQALGFTERQQSDYPDMVAMTIELAASYRKRRRFTT
jgi:ribosomal protein S18 acetylase RimI-like enzyme